MCCSCALRFVLGLANVLIAIVGIVLVVVGGILAWGVDAIKKFIDDILLNHIKSGTQEDAIKNTAYKIIEITAPLGIILFAVGLTIFIICLFGAIGSCKHRTFLKIYLVLHGLVILAEVILIIIYFARKDMFTQLGINVLSNSVRSYVSMFSKDVNSAFLTIIMPLLRCCGVNDGYDFDNSPNFKRQVTYNNVSYNLRFPIPCCKFDQNFEIQDSSCPQTFTPTNSNYNTGCWGTMEYNISKYMHIVAYVCIGIIVFQVLLFLLALFEVGHAALKKKRQTEKQPM